MGPVRNANYKLIYSVVFYDIGTAMRKQKMTKHCYLYVYHRRYIPSYICIILSDEGFTNTKHTFQRILCTR